MFQDSRSANVTIEVRSSQEASLTAYETPGMGLVVELHDHPQFAGDYSVVILSVYCRCVDLGEDEFLCQNYGPFKEILRQLVANGLVEITNREFYVWFAEHRLPVCRLKGQLRKNHKESIPT
jgi:hypothetical protein